MVEQGLRLDPALEFKAGPVPDDLAEGWALDGSPLILRPEQSLMSMSASPPAPGVDLDWGGLFSLLQGALLDMVPLLQWLFFLYFFARAVSYLLLNLMPLLKFRFDQLGQVVSDNGSEVPVSLILPAGNDASAAIACIQRLLRLEFPEFEILVVVDSQQSQVLHALLDEYSMVPFPAVSHEVVPSKHIKAFYASSSHLRLRLLEKEGAGRADALNAALNYAFYPLVCAMETRYFLRQDGLKKISQIFRNNPQMAAACASIEAAGRDLQQEGIGFVECNRLPRSWMALSQMIEQHKYERFSRISLSRMNALLLTSESLNVLRKDAVIAAGAYRSDVLNAEMELPARMHLQFGQKGMDYQIAYIPYSLFWAEMPANWGGLKTYSITRQASLMQSLELNRKMLFNYKNGAAGLIGFPFVLLFEGVGPCIELLSYIITGVFYFAGLIDLNAFASFWLLVLGLGCLLSLSALAQEAIMFNEHINIFKVLRVFIAALLENLVYRQLTVFWRVLGLLRRV